MDPRSDHRLLSDLLLEVLDQPAARRPKWLATHVTDGSIRTRLQELLAAHEAAEAAGHLESPPFRPIDPFLGHRIGPWQLTSRIGEGGMGVVYRAQRADGVYDRTVAIKLLQPGPHTNSLARRLMAESRIVAELDHPHIARLYDSGVTADGLPYLALEYVQGISITEYASHHALPLSARLALFLQVCDAVAYAHRHLVVHRDLKPSNILVGDTDKGPHVRLVDFGIATWLTDDGGTTRSYQSAHTPAYAAPEQVTLGPITTATDVYALGVLLYELLAGRRPYELAGKTPSEVEQLVCHTRPARPSEVVDRTRAGRLRGDLDTIILKALEKDPARRYRGADELAGDIQRHLAGYPIEARPASIAYRLTSFLRRRRAGVATALGMILLVGIISINYTVQLRLARDEARAAAIQARDEADRAEAIAGFLERILRAPNPRWYVDSEVKGPDVSVRDVLEEASTRIDTEFAGRPDIRADLHHILGDTYNALGLNEQARHHHRVTLRLRRRLYPAPDPHLAEALYYAGMMDSLASGAFLAFWEAAEMLRQRPEGNNFPFLLQSLAAYTLWAGQPAEADSLLREAAAYAETHFVAGSDGAHYRHGLLLNVLEGLAQARVALGDLSGAETYLDAADSLLAQAPAGLETHTANIACLRGLAAYHRGLDAEADLWQCLETSAVSRFRYAGAPPLYNLLLSRGDTTRLDTLRQLSARSSQIADSMARGYAEARLTAR